MKFHVNNLTKLSPRLGVLKDAEKGLSIKTPTVLLHTQGGHIPHITHEVFKLVSREPQILQIPLASVHNFKETMQLYNGSIAEFIGSKESFTCLMLQDPSNITQQGHHVKGKVPVWTKQGKMLYDSESYMNLVETFKPNLYCFLTDGDTNISSSQKRAMKAVDNTLEFYDECLERHKKSEVLKSSVALAAVTGGYSKLQRQRCIDHLLDNKDEVIGGFLIDGLHNNGPEIEFLPFSEVKPIVEYVIERLPEDKLRVVQGCWNPVDVIKLAALGIDMFDTSYCRIMTERSSVMTFAMEETDPSKEFEINLRHAKYVEDFQPILSNCQCLACGHYSRGYIHHLLTVQELLGPILIMIHNLHHYLRLFEKIREFIDGGRLGELEERVWEQFKKHQEEVLSKKKIVSNSGQN